MANQAIDFETISKALKQSYDVLTSDEKPSETAMQMLLEAKESLNDAILYALEKDRPAI
ncbi:hypothetical protein [Bacillus sp. FJAT-49736]|uniref:hypothetical protein n=1 Tax=Bacillus sp. FJAT-49736 TaxID=2833582 RepID=UPI001BC9F90C|nr:hypothetical protein [Bacillus sp. FJAT-49736]MBS4173228.1 hypothetical protein [Bacillus sp. FJAT-49736]